MLRLIDVSKVYDGGVTAVDHVSLEVLERQFVAIMGRSGSGKSTLLNLIAGIDRPTSGQIWIGEQELSTLTTTRSAATVLELIRRLSAEVGAAIVLVTHSVEAAAGADRILEMSDGRFVVGTEAADGRVPAKRVEQAIVKAPQNDIVELPSAVSRL